MRSLPNNGSQVQESLDMLLTVAAFDQAVQVLFLDDGVFQLKRGQNPERLGLKDTSAILRALELYDVNTLYVELESLSARGLAKDDLLLPVKLIPRADVHQLLLAQDVIVSD